jgi:hypothetical protein
MIQRRRVVAEERDRWGETEDERTARILARDVALLVYEESMIRDGCGSLSGGEALAFKAGYHAGRADALGIVP